MVGPDALPFTIVIPVYNRAHVIGDTLSRFCTPDSAGLEVIVVDDGSTDHTVEVIEGLAADSRGARIRVVRQANAGPGAARNRGAREASGTWLAFLDSDDIWFPWTAEVLAAELKARNPAFAFLQTVNFADACELAAYHRTPTESVEHDSLYVMRLDARLETLGSCNMVVRKDIFLAIDGFETSVRCGEDTDLFFRSGDRGPCLSITAPVMMGYRHNSADSLSRRAGAMEGAFLYKIRRFRAGFYPQADAQGRAAMLKMIRVNIQSFFANGDVGTAYRVYAAALPIMIEARDWHHVVRLPLTPLLALVRPGNYRFRWRAPAG